MIKPTLEREYVGVDHLPKRTGRDNAGRRWRGYSRIKDRAARRKANRRRADRLTRVQRWRAVHKDIAVVADRELQHLRDIEAATHDIIRPKSDKPCVPVDCGPDVADRETPHLRDVEEEFRDIGEALRAVARPKSAKPPKSGTE